MRKALVVGINAYPVKPLKSCINDATAIARLLERNADGSKNFDVQLETTIFTRRVLRREIISLFKGAPDIALFYFAGHGAVKELGGYLLTPDAEPYDDGVLLDEVLKLANESRATNKIIILECCYGGSVGVHASFGSGVSALNDGVVILAASSADEKAYNINGQGIFTTLLADALEGAAADLTGKITPAGIYAHIDAALGPFDQRPVLKINTHHLPVLRMAAPLIPHEVLLNIILYFRTADDEKMLDRTYELAHYSAQPQHVKIFKELKQMQIAGLVKPTEGDDLYASAVNNTGCRLTALGRYYWRLAKEKRI